MEQNLQEYNSKQNLLEWSNRISECRNSGMSVREWCRTHGIPVTTYYNWQRKVFAAVKTASEQEQKVQFAEIRMPKESGTPTATIRIGKAEADIYPGADEEVIRTIITVLKSC